MKLKCLMLSAILIALVGCNKNNENSPRIYDINEELRKTENEVFEDIDENLKDNDFSGNNDDLDIAYDTPEDTENIPSNTVEESPLPNDTDNPFFLSTYTTKILTTDSNRYNNIKIVSDKLNNYILQPGEIFSFNDVCGPFGESSGFLEATILLSDGTESKGFGGGVCQLSSTLYNAIKNLEVDITERHHHSAPVAYVPENEDATVSMQSGLDFKFINKYDVPIKFTTSCNPDEVTVNVQKVES